MKDISTLAAKQKRLLDWQRVLDEYVTDSILRQTLFEQLKSYRNALTRIWKSGEVTSAASAELVTLERELERLAEYARLRTYQNHQL